MQKKSRWVNPLASRPPFARPTPPPGVNGRSLVTGRVSGVRQVDPELGLTICPTILPGGQFLARPIGGLPAFRPARRPAGRISGRASLPSRAAGGARAGGRAALALQAGRQAGAGVDSPGRRSGRSEAAGGLGRGRVGDLKRREIWRAARIWRAAGWRPDPGARRRRCARAAAAGAGGRSRPIPSAGQAGRSEGRSGRSGGLRPVGGLLQAGKRKAPAQGRGLWGRSTGRAPRREDRPA